MNRREFLKIGGYAAIAGMGLGAVRDAMAHGILPAIVGGGGVIGWSSDSNTLVWGMTGAASANETGTGGGLAGADLVATQVGNVPGSTGNPVYRQLTAASTQYFTHTLTAGGLIAPNGGAGWTVGFAVSDFADSATSQYIYWYTANDAGRLRILAQKEGTTGRLNVGMYDVDAASWKMPQTATTDAIPSTGYAIVMVWYDGTYFRAGFTTGSTTIPTKWSDFAATKRLTATATSNATGPASGIGADESGGNPCTVKLHSAMIAKTSKINNAL